MIQAKNLTKNFDHIKALDDVTLQVESGSVFGLIGSNGSGKSTLLRLIAGVLEPTSGFIGIDNLPTFNHPELKTQIVFLGDTPYFFPQTDLTEMKSFMKCLYTGFDPDRFEKLLKVFPLNPRTRIGSMSKGMQRQAALILWLSTRPRYLLMDEAFDGLDVVMRRVLANLVLESVEKEGLTTIISSHNLRELEDLTDRVGLLHQGKVLLNDTTSNLQSGLQKVQAAFSESPAPDAFASLSVLKEERSGSFITMVVRGKKEEIMSHINALHPIFSECIEPSLEEVFLYELEVTGYDIKNILSD